MRRNDSVSSAFADDAKAQLGDLGARPAAFGMDDGELLIALVAKRRQFDPFKIFCELYGNLISTVGTTVILVVSVMCMLLALGKIADAAKSGNLGVWDFVKGAAAYWPILLTGGAGLGIYAASKYLFSDEDEFDGDDDARNYKVAVAGLQGLILGFLPAPLMLSVNNALTAYANNPGPFATAKTQTPPPGQTTEVEE